MALLRGVCLAVGITIEAIPYNFESSDPFTSDHILAFHPVARHAPPELPDLSDMMTKARDLLARAESIGVGLEMLEHTLQAVYHIMGPHTQLAATAHQLLASAYFQLGDPGKKDKKKKKKKRKGEISFILPFFFCCRFCNSTHGESCSHFGALVWSGS